MFVSRGRSACSKELEMKRGVKISRPTLDTIVCTEREAKEDQVCLESKDYDAKNKFHCTAKVKKDYVELITEFAHTWKRLTVRHLALLLSGKGYSFCKTTVFRHLTFAPSC